MNSYTGKFRQIFTSGKFDGIVLDNQKITFPTKAGFYKWIEEINRKQAQGSLNYIVVVD